MSVSSSSHPGRDPAAKAGNGRQDVHRQVPLRQRVDLVRRGLHVSCPSQPRRVHKPGRLPIRAHGLLFCVRHGVPRSGSRAMCLFTDCVVSTQQGTGLCMKGTAGALGEGPSPSPLTRNSVPGYPSEASIKGFTLLRRATSHSCSGAPRNIDMKEITRCRRQSTRLKRLAALHGCHSRP